MEDTMRIKVTTRHTHTFAGDPPGRYMDLELGAFTVPRAVGEASVKAGHAEEVLVPSRKTEEKPA